ncbi:ABC transporter ATP-binding protein [Akkermansiaceae bacterium]|nr:ABC transporter ATP-binding protein [Akkermansiaceae bacterium]MDB4274207.1 ABC transporter ATP-binding protein [Akkermansiaceae bacterium]MDB4570207.1 ABC transporter ATP-binding protein [Akkermansiaceae bacterium]
MIEIVSLSKHYGRHHAVDGISFEVQRGDIVGFLGPNGAGKTTTLRMLTGYLPPTSGAARIAGFDIFRESLDVRKKIGYMPENVPLYIDMRVKEYLRFRGALRGLSGSRLRTRLGEVMETCGLSYVRRKMIKTLSKGYRQRVGLADALIHEPELLILDEPTNGLDPNQIRAIRRLIQDLGQEHTILLSTHILSEVEMTCNKVVIIDEGKVKAADSPSNLVKSMRRAGRVTMELRISPEVGEIILPTIENVTKVTSEPLQDGWTRFSVFVAPNTDTRIRLASLAAEKGWPLRSLARRSANLEEVFVELTRKD